MSVRLGWAGTHLGAVGGLSLSLRGLFLSLSHTHTHSLSITLFITRSLYHSLPLTLSLSLSLSLSRAALSLSLSLSFSRTHLGAVRRHVDAYVEAKRCQRPSRVLTTQNFLFLLYYFRAKS